jgi:hypothetical protein
MTSIIGERGGRVCEVAITHIEFDTGNPGDASTIRVHSIVNDNAA